MQSSAHPHPESRSPYLGTRITDVRAAILVSLVSRATPTVPRSVSRREGRAPRRSVAAAHVEGGRFGDGERADVLLVTQAAPSRDITGGGRVVGEHAQHRADWQRGQ